METVQRILPIVIGQVRKGGFYPQSVPHNPAVDPFRSWHASVRNHLVELCRSDANVSRRLFA
jgi:hypothetical protein